MRGLVVGMLLALSLLGLIHTAEPTVAGEINLPQGYQAFEFPREFKGNPLPGAIVAITSKRGFRYLGHLVTDCGLDKTALSPIPGLIALRSFNLNENASASLAAGIASLLSINTSANRIRTISVTLGPTRYQSVIPIRAVRAATQNRAMLLRNCGQILKEKNVFWISDALLAESFTMRFKNKTGADLKITAEKLPKIIISAKAGVKYNVTKDGNVEVKVPVYIGFRGAYPSELLTGKINPFSIGGGKVVKDYVLGDDIYANNK